MQPTAIYTDRTAWYELGRPTYPAQAVDILLEAAPAAADGWVADVGAGTGAFSQVLLDAGISVVPIEPNPAMRAAAAARLARWGVTVLGARAEHLCLADGSVDAITIAQALHWFDLGRAGHQMRRVLRPNGVVMAIWNERQRSGSAFATDYEQLLRREVPAYASRADADPNPVALVGELLGRSPLLVRRIRHRQSLDEPALQGRVLSNSYAPASGSPSAGRVRDEIARLFARHEVSGSVWLEYDAIVVAGSFAPSGTAW